MTDAKKATKKATKGDAETEGSYEGFSEVERAAMKDRAAELKTAARRSRGAKADDEAAVLAKIAEMPPKDRAIAEKLHAIVQANAPTLSPKLWYGMPGYARNGKVMCFFQSADKFSTRYCSLGFNDNASLDDGAMWPTAYALTELNAANEARIGDLIKQAAS